MSSAVTSRQGHSLLRRGLGFLDALATPHSIDRYLELINPMLAQRELRGEVERVVHPTRDSVTLTVRPTRAWTSFEAGQFVAVTVLIDGVRRTRCYSPANSQHHTDGRLELTIKVDPEGIVSPWLFQHAAPGMVLGLAPADGSFVLAQPRPEKLLLVSGGSGITPVLSMLRTLIDEGHSGEVVFLHYAYTSADVPGLEELRQLVAGHPNHRLVLTYTDATDGDMTGFFGQHHLDEVAPWFDQGETYVCGPPGLMKALREHYDALGIIDRLHVEEFSPPIVVNPDEAVGDITFAGSRITVANSGETLLLQAESAGLHPEYGCRMGICYSCTSVKKHGCVRNAVTGELHTDPDEEIQLCVCVPLGDVEIEI